MPRTSRSRATTASRLSKEVKFAAAEAAKRVADKYIPELKHLSAEEVVPPDPLDSGPITKIDDKIKIEMHERQMRKAANENRLFRRIEKIADAVATRARKHGVPELYIVAHAMVELEEARITALQAYPPQASAAVAATMGKAKLAGLIVERSEIGLPGEFAKARSTEQVLQIVEERGGREALTLFTQFLKKINSKVIEGEVIEVESDE
jgi:hypothetical protein